MSKTNLVDILNSLSRTLPPGAVFRFGEPEGGMLWLDSLYIPPGERGCGTRFLASVVALADEHGVELRLHADPTDEPGDPFTCDLARWYARFGFEIRGLSGDEWVEMGRAPREPAGAEGVLAAYADAKANRDMSQADFEETTSRLMSEKYGRAP